MLVVAINTLARSVDDEIAPIAADLGLTAYDVGLMLRAPMPVVVARTDDRARAAAILGRLRERGHDAVALDTAHVVSSDAMTAIRLFRFDDDAFVTIGANGGESRAGYGEIVALVRAMHVRRTETIEKEKRSAISVSRAVMTGGLLATKTVESERTRRQEDREHVVYVFRRDGAPLLLRASHARYEGLGAELKPTVSENLQTFVRVLRGRSVGATVDDRLLAIKHADPKTIDLLATIIAVAVSRHAHAYRGT